MAADSSSAGYLAPALPGPAYDNELEDIFQAFVSGVTGIPGSLVRPRWQVDVPNMPDFNTDWVAVGVAVGEKQWNAFQKFDPLLGPDGSYVVEGVEVVRVTFSFYGPHNEAGHRMLEDGIQVSQNRDVLADQKITFRSFDTPANLPVLLKQRWVLRADVVGHFNRWVTRVYPVGTFRSATADLDNERYVTHISVTPPSP